MDGDVPPSSISSPLFLDQLESSPPENQPVDRFSYAVTVPDSPLSPPDAEEEKIEAEEEELEVSDLEDEEADSEAEDDEEAEVEDSEEDEEEGDSEKEAEEEAEEASSVSEQAVTSNDEWKTKRKTRSTRKKHKGKQQPKKNWNVTNQQPKLKKTWKQKYRFRTILYGCPANLALDPQVLQRELCWWSRFQESRGYSAGAEAFSKEYANHCAYFDLPVSASMVLSKLKQLYVSDGVSISF